MPIEPTPLEQELLAEAVKFTLVPTVLPFDGLLIVTPAKAEAVANTRMVKSGACFFI